MELLQLDARLLHFGIDRLPVLPHAHRISLHRLGYMAKCSLVL